MAQLKSSIALLLILVLISSALASSGGDALPVYNIADYGAQPDGRTDAGRALLGAWEAACGSPGAATVHVPAGSFLVRGVAFRGPCRSSRITFRVDGALVAPSGYTGAGELIVFDSVDGLSLLGGTIDGRGGALWACKASGGRRCPRGATSLTLRNSKDVEISGLTSVDSELYHVVIHQCEGVAVRGVRITAPGSSPNTDGIHVQGSSGVTIAGARIGTGDDCVSVGPGTSDLWIERVACGPGHGISIGSLGKGYMESGVENVTVRAAVFRGTQNGLRIKTWGRPSQGFVKGVVFEHAVMQDVHNPIIIDQNYCPHNAGCPKQNSGVKISEVTYSDIRGSSASQVAVNFDCSPSNPCTGIGLEDIELTYGNSPAESFCKHVDGTAAGFVAPPSCL